MRKKNKRKKQKWTVLAVIEGKKREASLLRFLKNIYLDQEIVAFNEDAKSRGNPDEYIAFAIKNLDCGKDRIFVWIDEDRDIQEGTRKILLEKWRISKDNEEEFLLCNLGELQKKYNQDRRNPVLVVSQPVSVESLILRLLGKKTKYSCIDYDNAREQTKILKNSLDGVFANKEEYAYYKENITKKQLEEKRKTIPELDLLISMITKG